MRDGRRRGRTCATLVVCALLSPGCIISYARGVFPDQGPRTTKGYALATTGTLVVATGLYGIMRLPDAEPDAEAPPGADAAPAFSPGEAAAFAVLTTVLGDLLLMSVLEYAAQ